MRRVVVFLVILVFGLSGLSWSAMGDQSWEWSESNGSNYYSSPKVAIDSQGNRIFAYTIFDSSLSNSYAHVISFNSNGNKNWEADVSEPSKKFLLAALVVDNNDNVIVGGYENNGSDRDWKVVKFSSSGTKLREFTYDYGDDIMLDLAVDSHGNIIGVGETKGSTSSFYYGMVYFFSSSNVILWSRLTKSVVGRVKVDKNDNVIVLAQEENSGQLDWKIKAYSSSGTTLWSETFNSGNGDDYPSALAVDDGNVAVVGKAKRAAGDYDWKVLFYQVSGSTVTLKWSDQINGDGGDDAASSVAIDEKGNVVVGGYKTRGGDQNWFLVSYDSSTGAKRWSAPYDSTMGDDSLMKVATGHGIVVAVGYSSNGSDADWRVRAYSAASGAVQWDDVCDTESGGVDYAGDVAVDANGGAFVGGACDTIWGIGVKIKAVDYEGAATPSEGGDTGGDNGTDTGEGDTGGDNGTGGGSNPLPGWVLGRAVVRTINTPPQTPEPIKGTYLGFGDAAVGGSHFKLQASFPPFVNAQRTAPYEVKIFIAAQLPDDYSRLLYITSSNAIEYQPPDKLSSWKTNVKGIVPNTVILNTSTDSMPSGDHYWYTLVVPSSVPDDFSGVDWSTIPWEVTVNVLKLP